MVRIDLDGKVAVVTGGSRGIGAAIAKTLAAAGASVLVLYRQDEAAAQALVAEIGAAGGIAWPQQTDVRDAQAVASAIEGLAGREGRLDILVNNAGIVRDALVPEMSEEDWHAVLDTNLTGVFLCSRVAVRHMLRRRWGGLSTSVPSAPGVGTAGRGITRLRKRL